MSKQIFKYDIKLWNDFDKVYFCNFLSNILINYLYS